MGETDRRPLSVPSWVLGLLLLVTGGGGGVLVRGAAQAEGSANVEARIAVVEAEQKRTREDVKELNSKLDRVIELLTGKK